MSAPILLGGQLDRIPGSHDDGTDQGVLRTRLTLGDAVLVPPPSSFVATTSGSSIVTYPAGPLSGGESGRSGYPGSMHFNVGAGTTQFAIAEFQFYGRFFGLALMNRPQLDPTPFWDVEIDGRTYPGRLLGSNLNGDQQTGSVLAEGIHAFPIATDLRDHVHTVRIGCGSYASANNHLHILGLYLDKRYYSAPQPVAIPSEPVALTVASSATPDMTTEGTLLTVDPVTITTPSVPSGVERRARSIACVEFVGGSSDSDADLYQQLADGTWTRRWRASKDPWCDGVPALGTALYRPVGRMGLGQSFKAIIPFGSASGVKASTWMETR